MTLTISGNKHSITRRRTDNLVHLTESLTELLRCFASHALEEPPKIRGIVERQGDCNLAHSLISVDEYSFCFENGALVDDTDGSQTGQI
jgi:hypothetical protein